MEKMRNPYVTFVGKPEGKKQLGRLYRVPGRMVLNIS
jgi:hypothetical protein